MYSELLYRRVLSVVSYMLAPKSHRSAKSVRTQQPTPTAPPCRPASAIGIATVSPCRAAGSRLASRLPRVRSVTVSLCGRIGSNLAPTCALIWFKRYVLLWQLPQGSGRAPCCAVLALCSVLLGSSRVAPVFLLVPCAMARGEADTLRTHIAS